MASNVTRDHHLLTRNLKTNGKYLSGDGGDEGITIANDGEVHVNRTFPNLGESTYRALTVDGKKNDVTGGTTRYTGVDIYTGIADSGGSSETGTDNVYGIYNELTHTVGGAGTLNAYGIRNQITTTTTGTTSAVGTGNYISGADTSTGMYNDIPDGSNDLKFVSSADDGDYFYLSTTTHGHTTIGTVDDNAAAAHLVFDIDGNVGVGNTVPGSDLEISKVSGSATLELSSWSATATEAHAGKLKFQKSGTATLNTFTAGDHTTSGEILGRVEAWGVTDGDTATLSSYIEFANDAVSDADSVPGKILFATSDANDAGSPSLVMTLDDDQLVTTEGHVLCKGRFYLDDLGGEYITGDGTDLTISSGNDLTLDTGGDVLVSGADIKIDTTQKLYLDGGGDTYISEVSADEIRISIGGDEFLRLLEATTGNKIHAVDACIGFSQHQYSNSPTINFNDEGNKIELTLTSGITNLRCLVIVY